jgi:hypothetical protein
VLGEDVDWTIESKIDFAAAPNSANQQAGIMAYQDDDNDLRFALEASGTPATPQSSVTTEDSRSRCDPGYTQGSRPVSQTPAAVRPAGTPGAHPDKTRTAPAAALVGPPEPEDPAPAAGPRIPAQRRRAGQALGAAARAAAPEARRLLGRLRPKHGGCAGSRARSAGCPRRCGSRPRTPHAT